MTQILVPIFVCVVLPVSIVLIVFLASMYNEKLRARVIMKAIEANNSIDTDKLAQALSKPVKTDRQVLNSRLLSGCIFSLVGLFVVIIGLVNLSSPECTLQSDPVTIPLIFGGASLAIGISYLIVFFVTRKQIENSSSDKQ